MKQSPMKNRAATALNSDRGDGDSSFKVKKTGPSTAHKTGKMRSKLRTAMASPNKHSQFKPFDEKDSKPVELSSPTSISMKNSFIIKNADASFDSYFNSMRKRTKGAQN
jgi:hypothetical protein